MKFITIRRLQREFGLPFVAAAGIIGEQRRLAWKNYRPLRWLTGSVCLVIAGSAIFDIRLPRGILPLLWLVVVTLAFMRTYLVHRASREPILAAARAQSAQVRSS